MAFDLGTPFVAHRAFPDFSSRKRCDLINQTQFLLGISMAPPIPFGEIDDLGRWITTFSTGSTFPESVDLALAAYEPAVQAFSRLAGESTSSADLLSRIRSPAIASGLRMSLLKIFRRCVCPSCDTEMSKKISKVPTSAIVEAFCETFKGIAQVRQQFTPAVPREQVISLCVLLAENDNRGQSGYMLTGEFFDWFSRQDGFGGLEILGPRGAGRDIELSTLLEGFPAGYPCDLVIRSRDTGIVQAVGFARYDSTRGGSQSDDRTGGNQNKVEKARAYQQRTGRLFRLLFLSDGPGLLHRDTLEESQQLDGQLAGAVRVTTLKLAPSRVTPQWLTGQPE